MLLAAFAGLAISPDACAAEPGYPQIVKMRYEAADPKVGGNFVIWLDRERLHHGLDKRLYPAARYVDVTHITPTPGSPTLTVIEVMGLDASTPDFYHVGGIVRFKITGMVVRSKNLPDR